MGAHTQWGILGWSCLAACLLHWRLVHSPLTCSKGHTIENSPDLAHFRQMIEKAFAKMQKVQPFCEPAAWS